MSSVSGSGERLLAILSLFTEARPEWQAEEVMEALGYTRPTCYRYLKTLKDSGYLTSLPQAGYTLGPRVAELDFLMRRSDPLIAATAEVLPALAAQARGSAFVLRWYGHRLLCIASETASDTPLSSYPRGRPMPLGRGAGSRAIAAFLPARLRSTLIDARLQDFATSGIPATPEAVQAELTRVRRAGIAVARGEVTPGLVGIAAPLLSSDGTPLGALCLSTEEAGLTEDALTQLTEAVKAAAQDASARLGHGAAQAAQ